MHRFILILFVFSFTQASLAEAIKFDIRLAMNGQEVSRPTMLANIGKETSMIINSKNQSAIIKVHAEAADSEASPQGELLVSLKIQSIENGKRRTVSQPTFLAKINEEINLKQYDVNGQETLSLYLRATKPQ